VFDPLTPSRLVAMLGELLHDAGRWPGPLDEFRTSQLLSASSIARYLSAELSATGAELARFAQRADDLLASAQDDAADQVWRDAVTKARRRVMAPPEKVADPAGFGGELGSASVEVLRAARVSEDPGARRFVPAFHGLLADLADRHVALLGKPPTKGSA
jgi:hypothetical protein